LSPLNPPSRPAGPHEAGVTCPHCNGAVAHGATIVDCSNCGAVQHADCWHAHGGCGTYQCAPARRAWVVRPDAGIRITEGDLDRAVPLPRPRPAAAAAFVPPPAPVKSGVNGLAIAALIVAVAGIVLVGAVTGLVAILLGSLALGSIHRTRQRGTALAVSAVLLGVVDVGGWVIFLSVVLSRPGPTLAVAEFEPDQSVLDNLAPHMNRAMRANVLIEVRQGWRLLGATGIGSGVIVRIHDEQAVIVTNRHVVDADFADSEQASDELPEVDYLGVKLIGQPVQPGRILWVAPDGVDLAVISVPIYTDESQPAVWERDPKLAMGDEVFSIGNPQRLGWSHTRGTISQVRIQRRGGRRISIIQTDTAINPGNSGGGLYDQDGMLIGINTWTNDKRFSEGLSFALAFQSLLQLNPPFPELPAGGEEPDHP
jgi:hypothetical protein